MSDCREHSICDELCLIIDLEGFTIQGEFQVRELGYYSWQGDRGGCFFDVTVPYRKLNKRDRSTVALVTQHVSGLPYRPSPKERPVFHRRDLKREIRRLYREFSTDVRRVVGFKGGHFEKDILVALKIPYKNIEEWGCPRYDEIRHSVIDTSNDVGCGCHKHPETNHCPQVECEVFWEWTRRHVFF